MTTPDPTTVAIAAALKPKERAALKQVCSGKNLSASMFRELEAKSLCVVKYGQGLVNEDVPTDLGREVLRLLETSAPEGRKAELTDDMNEETLKAAYDKYKAAWDRMSPKQRQEWYTKYLPQVITAARQSPSEQAVDDENFVPNKKFSDMTPAELAKWHADEYKMWVGETVEETFAKDNLQQISNEALASGLADESLQMELASYEQCKVSEQLNPITDTSGWYYSSVAQWMPEYSIEKINGFDGPFPTWQDALGALFAEVSIDEDENRKELANLRAQLAAQAAELERQRARLREAGKLVEALEFYANDDNWNLTHRDDNDSFYSNIDADSGSKAAAALVAYQQAAPAPDGGGE